MLVNYVKVPYQLLVLDSVMRRIKYSVVGVQANLIHKAGYLEKSLYYVQHASSQAQSESRGRVFQTRERQLRNRVESREKEYVCVLIVERQVF